MFRMLYRHTIGRVLCLVSGEHRLRPVYQRHVKRHGFRCYMFECERCSWKSKTGRFVPWLAGIKLERKSKPIVVKTRRAG